jgi:threonyl-tRNA synthetase
MFPSMDVDGNKYYLKPMNCPHHHKIFSSYPRTYKDLPLKLTEYGTCYRYEKSGQLFGLMRVRSMQMNDAHIYCSEKDFKKEFLDVCKMYLEYFDIFGIKKYQMRLSLHDKANLGKKYINQPDLWIKTEDQVRKALEEGGINFTEIPGEAAFYGPKVDVQVWSAIGKEFTLATNQVDFAIPRKFDLSYTDEHGNYKTPLCIHRAPLSTHERFIGFLIEHFGGDFPLWLAPVQIVLLPISDKYLNYANNLKEKFVDRGFRVKLDDRPDKIGAKIRQSEIDRIPLMVVVGEKEEQDNSLSLRRRFIAKQRTFSVDNFILDIQKEIMNRSLPNRES